MRRWLPGFTFAALLVPALASAQAPGPYYARGNFYCASNLSGITAPDSCYGYGPAVMLYDDGQHGDGADGDGIYGAWVTSNQPAGRREFKVANADWTFNIPNVPGWPTWNGVVFTSGPGDVVHFRLDMSSPGYGWVPEISVSNDHAYPPGAQLELMGSAPELGAWSAGLLAQHTGNVWSCLATIATPGTYEYKFRVLGDWNVVNFGIDYDHMQGRNGTFITTAPNTEMVIQFDELTGRVRAIDNHSVAARRSSWGRLKAIYR
jgi:hypothetical protein